jgi:hypothetical protein
MKKIIELIQQEINEVNSEPTIGSGATAMFNSTHTDGYVAGLEKAIELIKVRAAISVVEGSIMHNPDKMQEYLINLENGTIEKEYALIGMSKAADGYAATCVEFGDEKDGNTQFQAMVDIQVADQLFAYISCDWGVNKRTALIACKGFYETGHPIRPIMIGYKEK